MKQQAQDLSRLSPEAQDVFNKHQIRKTKQQKQAFRDDISSVLQANGWHVQTEHSGTFVSNHNVVVGNPHTAKYIFTAHYDTPAVMPFPNFITPTNPFFFILYQLLISAILLVPMILIPYVITLVFQNFFVYILLLWISCFAIIYLMLAGPANKNNANDNTSGVLTLLEIALSLPSNLKESAAFVFFDNEEKGLLGSALFAKKHPDLQSRLFVNFDCVGDGSNFLLFPSSILKKDEQTKSMFQTCFASSQEISTEFLDKGFAFYPSDQRHFKNSVGVGSFNKNKIVGYYLSRIHTKKDIIFQQDNILYLQSSIAKLLAF